MFYDRFRQLCENKGVSCNKAALEIGLSNATPTKWRKTGATPTGETLDRIASYFGVTTDYLLGKETEKTPAETDRRNEISNRNYIRIAARNGSYQERTLTDEQLAALEAILSQMPDVPDSV